MIELIKKFDEFNTLNEDLIHGEQNICNRAFINGGLITFGDGSSVHPKEIVKVVNDAIMYLNSQYTRTFIFAKETLNIIYLAHSSKYKTMAVDKNMNLYLNAGFVYNTLKMDSMLVAAVLMHEVFHALFGHIERGKNWLAAQGKSKTAQNWHDTNLAADVEVNQTLVRIGLIDEERLVNEIAGIYLKSMHGSDVVPMEVILNDPEYMNKLREMCPPPVDPETGKQSKVKTSEEWDHGYKDAWNKLAGLIKKYGYKKVWQMLQDAGLINSVGEIYTKKSIDDIKALEFMQIKSYETFINEAAEVTEVSEGEYQTYDDGYMKAFGNIVNKLFNAMNPNDDTLKGTSDGDFEIESGIKGEDLDQIDLPKQENKNGKKDNKGLPENTSSESDDSENTGDTESNQRGGDGVGKGTKGKDSEDLSDDDINKLVDDIRDKTNNGETKISTTQEISIGGTGSFDEDGVTNDDLKEAGYSDEDIAEINKVMKDNETNNSRAKIEKAIEKMKRELPDYHAVKKCLNAIEIEANKYKNVWKDILKEFMAKNTRRAGNDKAIGHNDWIRKKSIARGEYGVHHQKTTQDPQDVNVYIDVSGSVDMQLLEIICKSLVVFTQQWKYSGINICPWATSSNGVFKVDDFYKKKEAEVTDEILKIVSTGVAQCGGGTDIDAAIDAMIDVVTETLNNPEKKRKDDIHIVITDGQFNYSNVENKIKQAILSSTEKADVAEKASEHTFWMIYDMGEGQRKSWINEIKKGKLIFINSDVVKNNK